MTDYYVSYVNLDHRKDRYNHMVEELNRINLPAIRQRGFPWKELDYNHPKYATMLGRTPGAIGCHYSQCEIMREAKKEKKHAFVMEDDLIFCSDFHERLYIIESFLENQPDWDVFWLGGTFHAPAFWHPVGESKMRPNCSANLGKDFDHTDNPRIKRTYGAFCTYAYIVNLNSIDKILNLFEEHLPTSIGIDWLFIKLQPQLKTFAFVPGCVKQMDNQSDIGNGMTVFSGFSRLNGNLENSRYWFQDNMNDFNPESFEWKQ
jgi:GR25 family glycosyltransferase involved in LPS biosynthesis